MLENKRLLVTGGTGSLGKVLTRRILTGEWGLPQKLIVLSRDEAKQHEMRLEHASLRASTDDVIYENSKRLLEFRIGDVRDYDTIARALRGVDIVFNAAALKQVPTCEYFPFEAVRTNVAGPENIARAIRELDLPIETVVGVSTDKACKPVNVMGMTKAIQERVFIRANVECPQTRFVCVRYGNVLASRGSVIPLFHQQIVNGGPITITTDDMTRFLLSLDEAVDLIFDAVKEAERGETYIPRVPSAKITDVAAVLIGDRNIQVKVTGIRPGEKRHEILVSEEEYSRTVVRGDRYVIRPILPELRGENSEPLAPEREYSSEYDTLDRDGVRALLERHRLLDVTEEVAERELLR